MNTICVDVKVLGNLLLVEAADLFRDPPTLRPSHLHHMPGVVSGGVRHKISNQATEMKAAGCRDPRHHYNLADYELSGRNDTRDHRGRAPNRRFPLIRRGCSIAR